MLPPRNRQETPPRRCRRPLLTLEILEDRTLFSATPPTTVLDLNGLGVNPTQYSSTDILVRFQTPPGSPGAPPLVAGTTLGTQLPLVAGLYEIDLSHGMSVAQALAAYSAEPGVLNAEPDYNLTVSSVPNDPLLSQQWALNNTGQNGGTPGADIHAEQAWNVTTGSPNIVVAVMDTGIDYDSPDLYDNIWINQAEIPNYWYTKTSATSGYDKIVYKSEIQTATPGIITFRDLNNPANAGLVWDNNGDGRIDAGDLLLPLSQGGWMSGSTQDGDAAHPDDLFGWNFVNNTNNPMDDNGHGTNVAGILGAVGNNGTGVAGVDWNVQIMPIEFIGSNGSGTISAFIQGLNYAVQHGAEITNNSWEGAPNSTDLSAAIQNAQQHGQIFVAAAGNEGSNDDTVGDYPASYSATFNNVVAVAATDNNDQLASFSNYGPQTVALAAPGVNILSTLPGGTYGAMSGTSMATPEVTATLALVWGEHPTWSYTQVINQVLDTTDKLPSLQGKVSTGGRLDVAAAVGWDLSTRITPVVTAVTPQEPTAGSMNGLVLTFNEPINVSSFTSSAVQLLNPSGQAIPVTAQIVPNSGDLQVELLFSTQTVAGNYTLYVGSAVQDLQGNPMAAYQTSVALQAAPASGQTYSNGTSSAVQANSTTVSTISVGAGTTVGQLQVLVNLSYPDDGELTLWLTSPKGTTILLAQNLGGTGANYQSTTFSDQATSEISSAKAPFAGTFSPQWQLSQLTGQNAAGTWKLTVVDSGSHSGTLNNWSLNLGTTSSSGTNTGGQTNTSGQTYSNGTPSAVQANSTTVSTISVGAGTTVGQLQVQVNLSYPDDGELTLWLTSPAGTTILLAQNLGGTGANYQSTTFTDQATSEIASAKAPFAGTFSPQWQLSQLTGQNAAGTWKLTVVDSGSHSGTLNNWSLNLGTASSSGTNTGGQTNTGGPAYSNGTPSAVQAYSTTVSTISVPAGTTVGQLQVQVNLSYPDDGELTLWLTSPKGTTILLAQNLGGTGANYQSTTFFDQAATGIASAKAPFAGTFSPQWELSQLTGQNAAGTWKLTVVDSGSHSGTLNNWSLLLSPTGNAASVSVSSVPSSSLGAGSPRIADSSASSASVHPTTVAPLGVTANPPLSPALADPVFASAEAMARVQIGLLVGKQTIEPYNADWGA